MGDDCSIMNFSERVDCKLKGFFKKSPHSSNLLKLKTGFRIFQKRRLKHSLPSLALRWIRSHENPNGGILVHSGHSISYPEVTGYLVPTFLQYADLELVNRLIRWVLCIQSADGY